METMRYSVGKHNDFIYINQFGHSIGTGLMLKLEDMDDKTLDTLLVYLQEEKNHRN